MFQALVLMGLAGLVALGLAFLLGEGVFGRRLGRLVAAARRLEKGAADATTGLAHTGDEIGQVAQAFDEMAQTLRLAEKNLLLQKLYFEQLLENLPEAVAITGPEGGVEQVNAEFGRLFGFSKEEVRGRRLYEVICPEGQAEEGKAFHRRAMAGEVIRAEAVRRRKGGTCLDVALVVAPRFVEGRYAGNLILYRDISERKRAEQEKLQSALLAATVQTAGAACHELNQPLQVLLGQLEIMAQMSHYDESIRARIKDSLKQVERLAEVTGNLQRITRYETKNYLAGQSILDIDRSSREK
jgi:PAS domain S-box-containing protein